MHAGCAPLPLSPGKEPKPNLRPRRDCPWYRLQARLPVEELLMRVFDVESLLVPPWPCLRWPRLLLLMLATIRR
jgi:hypothetical protein